MFNNYKSTLDSFKTAVSNNETPALSPAVLQAWSYKIGNLSAQAKDLASNKQQSGEHSLVFGHMIQLVNFHSAAHVLNHPQACFA